MDPHPEEARPAGLLSQKTSSSGGWKASSGSLTSSCYLDCEPRRPGQLRLSSEWVENDALTVKFELEVRPDDWRLTFASSASS